MEHILFAEVMVNLPHRRLNKVFHYSVPPELHSEIRNGTRVLIPLGNRTVDGYVIGLTPSVEVETKDIIAILDDEAIINAEMLALARWMSETYLCSLVDALHAVTPPGLQMQNKKTVILDDADPLKLPFVKESTFARMVAYLNQTGGKAELRVLEKTFGVKEAAAFVKELRKSGVGFVSDRYRTKVRKKTVQQIFINISDEEVKKTIAQLSKRAPKQAQALDLVASRDGVSRAELRELGCSPQIIKSLMDKGCIKIEEQEELRNPFSTGMPRDFRPMDLTAEQLGALEAISVALDEGKPEVFLIHGVTASGKTEVYLQAIQKVLEKGKQAIFLVPEISLTPQMVNRFRGRFGTKVAVLHSALSLGERYDQWRQLKTGQVSVVVGARSAVFAPVPNLGLIILDEEHESTYKQDDKPRYHAREIAVIRGQNSRCPVILGSATPSLESFCRARRGEYRLLSMPYRIDQKPMPPVEIVDLRKEMESGNRSIFSTLLAQNINGALDRQEQVILFLNRRGYSTFVVCRDCGYVVKCKNCNVTMTYHSSGTKMLCHYCDYRTEAPGLCPSCRGKHIRYFGLGTQRVEEEIQRHFPKARVLRMDVDTTGRKGAHEKILTAFAQGEADILVGTQMIAKGLDFPKVTLVGVIAADTSLNLPDFRSGEKTFQLLTQVAGRAGRDNLPGRVVIQTYNPEHYSIQTSKTHDYHSFYQLEAGIREQSVYPPFCQLLRILISGIDENRVIQAAHLLGDKLQTVLRTRDVGIEQPLLGPAPASLVKVRGRFRWQLCIKARDRKVFAEILNTGLYDSGVFQQFSDVRFSIEVDPQSLL